MSSASIPQLEVLGGMPARGPALGCLAPLCKSPAQGGGQHEGQSDGAQQDMILDQGEQGWERDFTSGDLDPSVS